MPYHCQHSPPCKNHSPKRKSYKTKTGRRCCELDKGPRPKTGGKCGTVAVRGRRGRVPLYKGKDGGVYYLTQTNAKQYVDAKASPKACGTGPKRRRKSKSPKRRRKSKSPKRRRKSKSPKRRRKSKSPKRRRRSKSPKRRRSKSPKRRRSKSPKKRHTKHIHVTRSSLKRKYLKDKIKHAHPKK